MINKLTMRKVHKYKSIISKFDASLYDYGCIKKVSWEPLFDNFYDSYYRTYDLISKDKLLSFKVRIIHKILYFMLILLGVLIITIFGLNFSELNGGGKYVLLILGLGLFFGISYKLLKLNWVLFFDKESKRYTSSHIFSFLRKDNVIHLPKIYSLQILIKEIIQTKKSERVVFDAYELNLILEDSQRVNLLNYCDEKSIRQQSKQLADFLEVPLWSMLDVEDKK